MSLGRSCSAAGGTTIRSTAIAAPVTTSGQASAARADSRSAGTREVLLLDGRQGPGRGVLGAVRSRTSSGASRVRTVVGTSANRAPPGPSSRHVPLDVGGHQVERVGRRGRVGLNPMVPYRCTQPAQVGLVSSEAADGSRQGADVSHPDWFDQSPSPTSRGGGRPAPAQAGPRPTQAAWSTGADTGCPRGPFFLVTAMSGLVTDLWWFDSVGYRNVFVIQLVTKVLFFAVGFVPHRARGLVEHLLGHRLRPFVVPTTVAQQTWSSIGEPSSPCAGSARSSSRAFSRCWPAQPPGAWPTYLLWRNGSDFGVKEPHFGIDVGFFVFDLPWWRFVVSFLTVVLMLALVAALLTHYVYGGLQLPGRGPSTRAAMVHIGALGALFGAHAGGGLLAGPLLPSRPRIPPSSRA